MHEKEALDRRRKKMGNDKNMPKREGTDYYWGVEEGREG